MKRILKFLTLVVLTVLVVSTTIMVPELHDSYLFNKRKSIVKVYSPKKGSGTGFIIKRGKFKYVVTNRHVCNINEGSDMLLKAYDGKTFVSKVLVASKHYDLCLMSAPQNYPHLSIASSSNYRSHSYVLGHPLGLPISLESGRIQDRSVIELAIDCKFNHSRKEETFFFGMKMVLCIQGFDAVRTNAIIHPGNSGSPILNIFGQFQGVAFAGSSRAQNVGYLIPLDIVSKFLDSIKYR